MPRRITIHEEDYPRLLEMSEADAGLILQNLIRTISGEETRTRGDAYIDYFSEVACQKMMRFVELSERQAANGRKGGAPVGNSNATSEKQPKNNPKTTQKQPKTNPNTNTNTNTNTNKKTLFFSERLEVLNYLNEKAGTRFKDSEKTIQLCNARMSEGFTVDNFKTVIDKKVKEWKGTEMAAYLRPNTLFAPSHFEEYLNAPEKGQYKPLQNSQLHHMMKADYDIQALEAKLIKN